MMFHNVSQHNANAPWDLGKQYHVLFMFSHIVFIHKTNGSLINVLHIIQILTALRNLPHIR